MPRMIRFCLSLGLLLIMICYQAGAQETTAAIVGTITDQRRAVLKGATVTVKDVDRGTVLTTETNASGAYNLPRVPVGIYEVTVAAAGFQTARQARIEVVLNQTARLDFQLRVGQASENVEVSG